MTTIRLGVLHPTGTAADARSTGSVEWVPSARRVVGGDVVLPAVFSVMLSATADVTVVVAPTTTAWVWRVLERVSGGSGVQRYLAVPDSVEVVDYATLVEVDPATLDPVGPPPADVWALALAAASEGLIGPAGVVTATAPVTYDSGTQTVGVTVGTTSGTLAAGDDSRIAGAAQKATNLSDLASAATARANLGLGTAATHATTDYDATGAAATAQAAAIQRANHTGTQAVGTITGLGDAAVKNTGTTAGTLAAGDDSRITGAVASATIRTITQITQAAYTALGTPDPNTLFVIVG